MKLIIMIMMMISDQIPTWQNSIPESVFKCLRKEIALRLAEKIMTFNSIIEVCIL